MPLKITAGPVVLLTSKNDQKKVFILGHFLVTLALLPPGLVASLVSGVSGFLRPCDFDIGATFLKVAL